MADERSVWVHLVPSLAPVGRLSGGMAVVIDVLRATTTIVYALAAGAKEVVPCDGMEEAFKLAGDMRAGKVLLGGERGGKKVPGFDLGNSPLEYTAERCRGMSIVLTTTNGTKALLRATEAERILVAGFVNFSAVAEQLKQDARPIHIVCAGWEGTVALEDTLLAGALVDYLAEEFSLKLNDGARLAWDCFDTHGRVLQGALEISAGGANLRSLGYDDDIRIAAEIDRFALVPELRRDPLRIEGGSIGTGQSRWPKK